MKPANIKISPDDVVRVLDFGIAKFGEGASGSDALPQAGTALDTHRPDPTATPASMVVVEHWLEAPKGQRR